MKKLQGLLILIGVVQVVLGVGFLLFPSALMALMGLSVPPPDVNYMLGMLGARFVAYGLGMFWIASRPEENVFWVYNMLLIQIIDLALGLVYTMNGTVPLAVSAFPMFNATVFIVLLWLWRPKLRERPLWQPA